MIMFFTKVPIIGNKCKFFLFKIIQHNVRLAAAGRGLLGLAGAFVLFSFSFHLPALDYFTPTGRLPAY